MPEDDQPVSTGRTRRFSLDVIFGFVVLSEEIQIEDVIRFGCR